MNDTILTKPKAIGPVTVRRHPVDWDGPDFVVVTAQRALDWDERLSRGCWFLNPRYSVHAETLSAAFFRKVREVQGSWLRTLRQTIHNRGLRHEVRRRDTIEKQFAFSGVLSINGQIIPPKTWNRLADKLLKPFDSQIVETHHHLDLAALKANFNLDPLKQLSRSALQAHLAEFPTHAAFVLPNVTISSPVATPAFYQSAERAQEQWCMLLNRSLGKAHARRARQEAYPESYALVFGGTLVVDGQCYWPGGWPNHSPRPGQALFDAPSVPSKSLHFMIDFLVDLKHENENVILGQ